MTSCPDDESEMACDGTFDAPHIEGEYAKNVTGTTGFLSQIAETKPAPERAPADELTYIWLTARELLGARVQHGDGTTVLRPAGDVVTDGHRALLAVGDRAHAVRIDAARGEERAYRLGTTGAQRDVVFAGATLVGVTFDGEGVARIGLEPLRLLFQRHDRLRGQIGLVGLEEHAVAHVPRSPAGCQASQRWPWRRDPGSCWR